MRAQALRQRIVVATREQTAIAVLILIASFIAQVGVARRFGPPGLGEYAGTTLVVVFASLVAISALPLAASEAVARHLELGEREASRTVAFTGFALSLASSAVVAIVTWMAWGPIADLLQLREPVPALAIALAIASTGALHYVPLTFLARLDARTPGLITIAQPFAVVAALGWDTFAPGVRPGVMAVLGYASGGAVAAVAFLLSNPRPRVGRAALAHLVRQTLRSLPLLYANVISAWVDRLLVSLLLGPAALGTYQAAAALTEGVLRLPRNLSAFLISAYARITAGHAERLAEAMRVHAQLSIAFASVLAAALLAGADGITTTLFGPGLAAASAPLRVLTAALPPGVLALSLSSAATGAATTFGLSVSRYAIPLQVALLVVLTPRFGVLGAAIAHVAAIAATFVGYLWLWRQERPTVSAALWRSLAVGLAAVAIAAAVASLELPWVVRSVAAALLVAALVSRTLVGAEERAAIRGLVAAS